MSESRAPVVEVVASERRRRTVSASREGDRIVVRVPARMSAADRDRWVARMVERLQRPPRRRAPTDTDLQARAVALSERYLDGRAVPASVRWVPPMQTRWASCTTADATIRLSRRLQPLPAWVVDYVILHELAHLLVGGHGPRFWALLEGYPRLERARGFLDGYAAAAQLEPFDANGTVGPGDSPGSAAG